VSVRVLQSACLMSTGTGATIAMGQWISSSPSTTALIRPLLFHRDSESNSESRSESESDLISVRRIHTHSTVQRRTG
jgi:hypothetical protein